jgi:hypothetical protein
MPNNLSPQRFQSFQTFWPFYLSEHRKAISRMLHYIGTVMSHALLLVLLIKQLWWYLPVVLLVGYGPAWLGHYLIEHNRPATFKYPFWSLLGDYKMLYLAITGRLKAEIEQLT